MTKFTYIMPDTGHGNKGIDKNVKFKPETIQALKTHITKDPDTGKNVTVSVLIHNLIVGGDPKLTESIHQTYNKLKRSKKDGGDNQHI